MGARLVLHAVNGRRDSSPWSRQTVRRLIDPRGNWACQAPPQGERLFVGDICLEA